MMKTEELMALLEGLPCEDEVRVAVWLDNGKRVSLPISGISNRKSAASSKNTDLLILSNGISKTLTYNPWSLRYRVKP